MGGPAAINAILKNGATEVQQTPVHEHHNPDLLNMMPAGAKRLIEIGCSSGALARAYKALNPACHYLGVEIDADYATLAKRFCDDCLTQDLESAPATFWERMSDRDCWVFGDTLEHFRDPWAILKKIHQVMPAGGVIVACVPNAQHWSVQRRLTTGQFRYEPAGLLDRTHLRWFTRQTLFELFNHTGFAITEAVARIFDEPERAAYLPAIEHAARLAGTDVQQAVADAMGVQYVVKALRK